MQLLKREWGWYALSVFRSDFHPEGPVRHKETCPNLNTESTTHKNRSYPGLGWLRFFKAVAANVDFSSGNSTVTINVVQPKIM